MARKISIILILSILMTLVNIPMGDIEAYSAESNTVTDNGNLTLISEGENTDGDSRNIDEPEQQKDSKADSTISGLITLPDGKMAPSGGINVNIAVQTHDNSKYFDTRVTIPENRDSAHYIITIPETAVEQGYILRYDILSTASIKEGYLRSGFYNESGITEDYNSVTFLQVGKGSSITANFELLKAEMVQNLKSEVNTLNRNIIKYNSVIYNTISGRISLPEGADVFDEDLSVSISATVRDDIYTYYETDIIIPAGENSTDYTISAPLNVWESKYIIGYKINDGSKYFKKGFYSTKGMTKDFYSATPVDIGGGSITEINMTFMKGNKISGLISLPKGKTAPPGGLEININADKMGKEYYIFDTSVTIPAGSSSTSYSIVVEANEANWGYRVSYNIKGESDFISIGYYGINGTTIYYGNDAFWVDVSIRSAEGINFTLLEGGKISGIVSLPGGEVAPEGGIGIQVYVQNDGPEYCYYSVSLTIPAGSNYYTYSVNVPRNIINSIYTVSYYLNINSTYFRYGHYSVFGTKLHSNDASPVDVSTENASGINLTLIEGSRISGTIYLPNGDIAQRGGLFINLEAGGEYSYNGYVIMPAGETSVQFELITPKGVTNSGYRIRYSIGNQSEYLMWGYYSVTGTVVDYSSATCVGAGGVDVVGLDLNILAGCKISGTISLPNGAVAKAGGIHANIYAVFSNPTNWSYYCDINIPEGSNSTNYLVVVPKSSQEVGYKIVYSLWQTDFYLMKGYYGTGGTVEDYESASLLYVGSSDIRGINLTLIQGRIISGNISLPGGEVAPQGGIYVTIYAKSKNSLDPHTTVNIAAGCNSVNYTLGVNRNTLGSGYKVNYDAQNQDKYIQNGYYNALGTTPDNTDATLVDVSNGDVTGINMTLLKIPAPNDAVIEGYVNIYLGEAGTGVNNYILNNLDQYTINLAFASLKFTLKHNASDTGTVFKGSDIFIPDTSGKLAVKDANNKVTGKFRIYTSDLVNTSLTIDGGGYLAKNISITLNAGQTAYVSSVNSTVEIYPGDLGSLNGSLTTEPDGKIDNIDFSVWLKIYKEAVADTASSENRLKADLSKDGVIDNIDFSLWLASYKKTLQ